MSEPVQRRSIRFRPALLALGAVALASGWLFVALFSLHLVTLHSLWAAVLNFDREATLPSWASSAMLLMLAGMAALAALGAPTRRSARAWALGGAVLLLMSMDETMSLHERSDRVIDLMGLSSGWMESFGFPWVVIGLSVALAVAAVAWTMRHDIPAETWRGLALAGAVFVAGALGVEVIGGFMTQADLQGTRGYIALTGLEESFEVLGLVLAGLTLDRHLARHAPLALSPQAGSDGPNVVAEAGSPRQTPVMDLDDA